MSENSYLMDLGQYIVERLRAILPDFEVNFQVRGMSDPDESLRMPSLAFRIRRWGRDSWIEDYHDDRNMASRQECRALECSMVIDRPPRDGDSILWDKSSRHYLMQRILDAWVQHRLMERGLSDKVKS